MIQNSTNTTRYKFLMPAEQTECLKQKKYSKMINMFRLGNEEGGKRYWQTDERKKCRIYGPENETLEHLSNHCAPDLNITRSSIKDPE